MPRIALIGSIAVRIYRDDVGRHRKPHFHAAAVDGEVLVSIPELAVLDGKMKPADLRRVHRWAEQNVALLIEHWNLYNPGHRIED